MRVRSLYFPGIEPDHVVSEVTPSGKASVVQDFQARGEVVTARVAVPEVSCMVV